MTSKEQQAEESAGGLINNERYEHIQGFLAGYDLRDSQSGWVSCKERLPEIRNRVLLKERYGDNIMIGFLCEAGNSCNWKTDIHYPVGFASHWMPLPTAPLPDKPKEINK